MRASFFLFAIARRTFGVFVRVSVVIAVVVTASPVPGVDVEVVHVAAATPSPTPSLGAPAVGIATSAPELDALSARSRARRRVPLAIGPRDVERRGVARRRARVHRRARVVRPHASTPSFARAMRRAVTRVRETASTSTSVAASSALGAWRRAFASDDERSRHEAMMGMEDAYGSGVTAQSEVESPEEKKRRMAEELERRGVLVGDRVRVEVRVGAPLPEQWRHTSTERQDDGTTSSARQSTEASFRSDQRRSSDDDPSSKVPAKKRWLTRVVFGYATLTRNGRVGVKRTGSADTDTSFPTYPKRWVTVLDVGELWEMCTGPRNPSGVSGASDQDMYEYMKATGANPENVSSQDISASR